jgi:osmoprotectant transport system ATP-binding protein
MIRLVKVSKIYDGTAAVNELSLSIEKGELCVLIGPSGCGKTTTLKMINRLVEPTSGEIWVNNIEIHKTKAETLRRSIGYAIQSVGLFPHMTVKANIAVVPQLLGWEKTKIAARAKELLTLVGLDPEKYLEKYARQLSGGEAQRIGVARALAADPPVLLMDEPFGAVDPLTRQRLQTQFLQIQKQLKKTIILVTHDLDEAIRLADRIAIMQSGRLIQHDTPETILTKPADKFVHDFVGVDRALKRLSRISVKDFVKQTTAIREDTPAKEVIAAFGERSSLWVIDPNGRPIGWVDNSTISEHNAVSEVMVRVEPAEMTVTQDDTLREAFSRMLGLGFKSLPVVDERQRFIGELVLNDIETATIEKDAAKNAAQ